jgi:hypothetical protein
LGVEALDNAATGVPDGELFLLHCPFAMQATGTGYRRINNVNLVF